MKIIKQRLDTLIVKHNLRESVRLFVTATEEEVRSQIRSAAMLVAPCVVAEDGSTGGVPSVLLEAMTAGTPCISTDVGGIPEVIVDGQTGVQIPQRDPGALASAIEQLLGDDVKRVRLALKARVLVEAEFNIHRNAERIRAFFRPGSGDGSPVAIDQSGDTNRVAESNHGAKTNEVASQLDESEEGSGVNGGATAGVSSEVS